MKAIVPKKTHIHAGRYATPRTGKGKGKLFTPKKLISTQVAGQPSGPDKKNQTDKTEELICAQFVDPPRTGKKYKQIAPRTQASLVCAQPPWLEKEKPITPRSLIPRGSKNNPQGYRRRQITPRTHIHAGLCPTLRTVKGNANESTPRAYAPQYVV